MEEIIKGFLSWGGPGLVILVLLFVMREMYRAGRETQTKLEAEKDARIADAARFTEKILSVKEESHKRDADLGRAVEALVEIVDTLGEKKTPPSAVRGRA